MRNADLRKLHGHGDGIHIYALCANFVREHFEYTIFFLTFVLRRCPLSLCQNII